METGDKIKAKKHFLQALDSDWHLYKTHKELGILELESNEQEKAKLHLSIALDLNPKEKSILKLLSKIQ
jgi:Tfp pilus assembly protein PilF